jgi:hypothetical protein
MKAGTRVVSNSFDMGEWTPDETANAVEGCTSYCRALFWIVPAKVAGTWKLPQGELMLEQNFQMISGTLKSANVAAPVTDGKLAGDQITFMAGGTQYSGRVSGDTMEGTSKSVASEAQWRATRAGK